MTDPLTNKKNSNLLLSFSPWMLATACFLLLLLLVVFTVSNYRREKELMGEALVQKGLTLIRFIHSSARESMRDNLRASDTLIGWEDLVQAAMDQAAEQPGVESVQLIDQEGTIVAATGVAADKRAVSPELLSFTKTLKSGGRFPFVSRITESNQGGESGKSFQIAAWHLPPHMSGRPDHPDRAWGRGQMSRRFGGNFEGPALQEEMRRILNKQMVCIVQLDFEQFSSFLKRQVLQIAILAIVTLLVAVAGALSYITLKGLRGSQQRLGEMRAFTDIVVSSLPVGLIATDKGGKIRVCNGAAGEILGTTPYRLHGQRPESCIPLPLAKMFLGDQDATGRQKEILIDLASDKIMTLQVISMAVMDSLDRFAGEVLLIRDLTAVKSLEKELQRNERMAALGKMAAGVAHELRNPLSSIKGLALLLKTQLSSFGGEEKTADILVKEVERLNRSIGELLDYARPEQLDRQLTELNELIEKTVSLVEVDAASYNISIVLNLAENLPSIYVDRDKVNQVVLNLLLNALQAMPEGGLLSVQTRGEGAMIVIVVKDSGMGISSEHLQRVFDPYFTTKKNGTGLGLALSSKIIEEHGGSIKIFSTPEEYTEVQVALPV
jgi:two-component system sensor histidine kinase HydH